MGEHPPATWEGDRWLEEALLPAVEALAAALRARPEWERDGFQQVVVFSSVGWHHFTEQEALLEAADRRDWLVAYLVRRRPPPDGRTSYAGVPIDRVWLEEAAWPGGLGWLADALLTQAVDAAPLGAEPAG